MIAGYPTADQDIQELVREHLNLRDEPLRLAIYYAPERELQDIFLFEIFDGFGANGIDPDSKFFEVSYSVRSTFHLEPGQALRLVVTNPAEFEKAARENWEHVRELRAAIAQGKYHVVYSDPDHAELAGALGA